MQRLLALIAVLAAFSTPVAAQPPGLVVSVAASMHDALARSPACIGRRRA